MSEDMKISKPIVSAIPDRAAVGQARAPQTKPATGSSENADTISIKPRLEGSEERLNDYRKQLTQTRKPEEMKTLIGKIQHENVYHAFCELMDKKPNDKKQFEYFAMKLLTLPTGPKDKKFLGNNNKLAEVLAFIKGENGFDKMLDAFEKQYPKGDKNPATQIKNAYNTHAQDMKEWSGLNIISMTLPVVATNPTIKPEKK